MVRNIENLYAEAMELDQSARAELAERLLNSVHQQTLLSEIEEAWLREAEDRSAAYHRGEIVTSPAEEILSELESGDRNRKPV
jgi:hypothetical protein